MNAQLRMTESQLADLSGLAVEGTAVMVCELWLKDDSCHLMVHRPADPGAGVPEALQDAEKRTQGILIAGRGVHEDRPGPRGSTCPIALLDLETMAATLLLNDRTFPTRTMVVGRSIHFYGAHGPVSPLPAFVERHAQCLGEATSALLRSLCVGVVGVSGTGSIVVEQLSRLGVGKLVLVEPDVVEERNLNRILNSGWSDIRRPKVDVAAAAIERMGLGTNVVGIRRNLASREAVSAMAGCDVVFGCVDSAEGRHVLNRLSTFYTIPYFDVGLRLNADGKGGIDQILGSVHVLAPDGSALLNRGVYNLEQVRYEAMRRTSPNISDRQLREAYIKGVRVDSPAVISFNMFYASLAVIEFLNRLHGFRDRAGANGDWICISLTEDRVLQLDMDSAAGDGGYLVRHVGRGDVEPLLDMPDLGRAGEQP